jgi:hypothetical protein
MVTIIDVYQHLISLVVEAPRHEPPKWWQLLKLIKWLFRRDPKLDLAVAMHTSLRAIPGITVDQINVVLGWYTGSFSSRISVERFRFILGCQPSAGQREIANVFLESLSTDLFKEAQIFILGKLKNDNV